MQTEDEPVRVVTYDSRWPRLFETERELLDAAIGSWAVGGIQHVGSTAVPGLDAKPVIDILVGVRDLETSRACFEPLTSLDYRYAPYRTAEMHWFCKPHPSRRTHHLHLVPVDSVRYRDELAFRDFLRAHPDVAAEYAALKHRVAEKFKEDREAYSQAKVDFVNETLGTSGQLSRSNKCKAHGRRAPLTRRDAPARAQRRVAVADRVAGRTRASLRRCEGGEGASERSDERGGERNKVEARAHQAVNKPRSLRVARRDQSPRAGTSADLEAAAGGEEVAEPRDVARGERVVLRGRVSAAA